MRGGMPENIERTVVFCRHNGDLRRVRNMLPNIEQATAGPERDRVTADTLGKFLQYVRERSAGLERSP